MSFTNVILSLLVPKPTEDDSVGSEATAQQGQSEGQKERFKKIDLTWSQDWSLDYQKRGMGPHSGIYQYIHYLGCGFG